MEGQTAQIYEQNDRLYLETFLIDDTVTKKGKKVNASTIDDNVVRSRKHPLTLYPRQADNGKGGRWIWDHPVVETNSLSENLELQKKYEIGYEIRSKKIRNGYWNAVYEITDPGAKNLFKGYIGQTIPFWTSSGIIHSSKEDPLDIKEWRIIHNAIVSEPANGFDKSVIVDICQGTEQTCSKILTASITPSFTFCTQTSLQNYISSLSSLSGVFPHYTMSSDTSAQGGAIAFGTNTNNNPGFTDNNAKTGMGSIATNLTPPNPDTAKIDNNNNKKEEIKEDKTDYKAIVKQLEDQLKSLKTEKEAKETENKTVTERIASLERENSRNSRKNQVLSLAQGYPEAFMDAKTGQINQELYSKTILEWIDKGFDDATIKELLDAKTLKFVSQLDKDGKCTTCSSLSSSTAQNHQTTTMAMTTASMSADSDSSLPIWEKIIDLTNANIRLSAEKYQKLGGKY